MIPASGTGAPPLQFISQIKLGHRLINKLRPEKEDSHAK